MKIKKGFKSLLVAFFALTTHATFATAELNPFRSSFVAYYDGSDVGEAHLSLSQIEESRYQLNYSSTVSKFFLSDRRYETSIFKLDDEELVPISYEYIREGTGSNKALSVVFDQKSDKIIIDDKPEFEWNDELDNQLFRVDLSKRLAQGERNMSYDFINYRGEKRHYELLVQGVENLSLPYGQLSAVKVKINRETNRRVTYAWFAPDLDFSLVRLQQFKEGKEQGDIRLASFERQ